MFLYEQMELNVQSSCWDEGATKLTVPAFEEDA